MTKSTLGEMVDSRSILRNQIRSSINKQLMYIEGIGRMPESEITSRTKELYYITKYIIYQWGLLLCSKDDRERFTRKYLKALEESEFYRDKEQ